MKIVEGIIHPRYLVLSLLFHFFLAIALLPKTSNAQSNTPTSFDELLKLVAGDPKAGDQFGFSAALDGDTLVVGAIGEDGGPGDPVNGAGAIYVFERDHGGPDNWGQVAQLHAGDPQVQDVFGFSVAISGNTIVAGAVFEDGGDGNPFPWGGAAYVFERDLGGPDNWGQAEKLSPSDQQAIDNFGRSVSIHGDTIVVGASGEDGGAGDPITDSGAAYVFERDQGGPDNWGKVAQLHAGSAQAFDHAGYAVDIHADTIVVGTWVTRTGGLADDAGAAFVFERDLGGSGNWGEAAVLNSADAQEGDQFGISVAIDGDTIVAGANREDGSSGDPVEDAGAAYVFRRDVGGADHWGQAAKLTAEDLQAGDLFGNRTAIAGDRVAIGAWSEDGGAGDPRLDAGAVYVFEQNQGGPDQWGQTDKLTSSDTQADDHFGVSTGLSGDVLVAGASFESGGDGDPLPTAGAVYVFEAAPVVVDEVIYLPVVIHSP